MFLKDLNASQDIKMTVHVHVIAVQILYVNWK